VVGHEYGPGNKGLQLMRHLRWPRSRSVFWSIVLVLILSLPSSAPPQAAEGPSDPSVKTAQPYIDRARVYIKNSNVKAAEIELRNAVRAAPQNAPIRALLAQVYLKLGNFASAEREARMARDLKAAEEIYLPILDEAL